MKCGLWLYKLWALEREKLNDGNRSVQRLSYSPRATIKSLVAMNKENARQGEWGVRFLGDARQAEPTPQDNSPQPGAEERSHAHARPRQETVRTGQARARNSGSHQAERSRSHHRNWKGCSQAEKKVNGDAVFSPHYFSGAVYVRWKPGLHALGPQGGIGIGGLLVLILLLWLLFGGVVAPAGHWRY